MARSRNRHLLTTTDRLGRSQLWWETHTLHGSGPTEEAARADYEVKMEALRASGLVHAPLGEPRLSASVSRHSTSGPVDRPPDVFYFGHGEVFLELPKTSRRRLRRPTE